MLELLQSWVGDAEGMARRVPELAAVAGSWSWAAALAAVLAGIGLLVAGARLGPVLTGVAGGLVGWLAGTHVARAAEFPVPVATVGWAVAASMGALSMFAPFVYPLLLGAVPGALLGLRAPVGGGGWVGAAVGAAALAGIAVLLRRVVVAGTAAVAGAVLLLAGLLALSGSVPALVPIVHRPVLMTGIAALLVVASTAFQAAAQGGGTPRARGGRGSLRHD